MKCNFYHLCSIKDFLQLEMHEKFYTESFNRLRGAEFPDIYP